MKPTRPPFAGGSLLGGDCSGGPDICVPVAVQGAVRPSNRCEHRSTSVIERKLLSSTPFPQADRLPGPVLGLTCDGNRAFRIEAGAGWPEVRH